MDLLLGVLLKLAWIREVDRWLYFPVRPYFLALMMIMKTTPVRLLGWFSFTDFALHSFSHCGHCSFR